MATLVTRSGKGSPLTHAEVDANFTNLNTDKLELSGGTMTGNLSFGDNDKAIFGAGSDLQIYHDGSNSYIDDTGAGDLILQAGNDLILRATDGTSEYLRANEGLGVQLYYNGDQKFLTTSTGIDVTGTVTADGLTVDGTGTAITLQSNNNAGTALNTLQFLDQDGSAAADQPIGNIEFYSSDFNSAGVAAYITSLNGTGSTGDITIGTGVGGSAVNRMKIEYTGDISFYEDTGTTAKFFWDASAERLGIGTGAPAAPLEVSTSTADYRIQLTHAFGQNKIKSVDGDQSTFRNLFYDAAQHFFEIGGSEAMRIDSSGNVGIGTSSPSSFTSASAQNLVVGSGSGNSGMTIYSGTTSVGGLAFADGTASGSHYRGLVQYIHSSDAMLLYTSETERMRIDSSGNLLVGKTSYGSVTGTGSQMGAGGVAIFTASSDAPLYLNRTTSDGTIIDLRKDGTTVGSIGNRATQIYIETPTKTGLDFAGDILPRYNGSLDNGVNVDLGSSGYRFKDLYLSGGVYLGGTGAANKLDDYEEGTWTPVVTPASGSFTTVTVNYATYVKVGGLVHVSAKYTLTTIGTGSGAMAVSGFPYTLSSGQGNIEFVGRYVNTGDLMAGQFSGSIALFQKYDGTSSTAASGVYTFMFTYRTDA